MIDFERSNCLRHLHLKNLNLEEHRYFYTNTDRMDKKKFEEFTEYVYNQVSNDIEDLDSLQKIVDVTFVTT